MLDEEEPDVLALADRVDESVGLAVREGEQETLPLAV